MDRLNQLNFGLAYLALVAAGAVVGGLVAAVSCLADWRRGRQS